MPVFLHRLRKLASLGVSDAMPRPLATRVRFTNVYCLLFGGLTLPLVVAFWLLGMGSIGLLSLPFVAVLLLGPILNAYGQSSFSRLLLVLATNAQVFYFSSAMGPGSGMRLFFIVLPFQSVLLFEPRERRPFWFAALMPLFTFALSETIGTRLIPFVPTSSLHNGLSLWLFLPLCVGTILFSVFQLWKEYETCEQALIASLGRAKDDEARIRALYEAIPDLVLRISEDGTILDVHRSTTMQNALPSEQLVGAKLESIYDTARRLQPVVLEVARTGTPGTIAYEHEFPGGSHAYEARVIPSAPGEVVVICQDISERRKQERIIEEQRARLAVSSRMSSLGEMSGGIAHEINNPLAIIHGKAGQLRQMASRGQLDPALVIGTAAKIEGTAMRIARIIRALRSFARDGENDPWVRTGLSALVEETLMLCGERFRRHGVTLEVEPISPELACECRPVQISQVLVHLLANAYDAVTNVEERWVHLSVTGTDDEIEISVTDSGNGIATDLRDRIFDPFFTTKEVGNGPGLGLSISSGILRSHGGSLRLDTESPHTRFVARFPRQKSPAVPAMAA